MDILTLLLACLVIACFYFSIKFFCKNKDEDEMCEVKIIKKIETPKEEENNSAVFRPSTFDEFIGQKKAKSILNSYIKAIAERGRVFPHTLVHGFAGCGKSTLVNIISKLLNKKTVEVITSSITSAEMLIDKIREADGGVLFLDEIYACPRDMVETIYMVMEDFKYNGEPIPPFTLIGATTELGEMIADRKPFVDRFKLLIELEKYNDEDLSLIAKQYQKKSFPNDKLSKEIFTTVGLNSRGTPRTAIRLTEASIYLNGDIDTVLNNFNIIKNGFTFKDLDILKYLSQNEKGVGLNGLVSYLGTSKLNYEQAIEPFLLQKKLLQRTPRGRKITEYGITAIKELELSAA